MSVGPLGGGGIVYSAAGSSLAQAKGSDADRTAQEVGNQQRVTKTDLKAEAAAGIGATDGENHEASERDADGRRLWEEPPPGEEATEDADATAEPHATKDGTGQTGNLLDLSG